MSESQDEKQHKEESLSFIDNTPHGLFKWAIYNQSQGEKPQKLDKEKLSFLQKVMGESDAIKMKETTEIFSNKTLDTETRKLALENMEMLVENIDNALDIEKLNLWPNIINLLNIQENRKIRFHALWIIGTASQNVKTIQEDLVFKYDLISLLLDLFDVEHENFESTKKLFYALSSILTNNQKVIQHSIKNMKIKSKMEQIKKLIASCDLYTDKEHDVLNDRYQNILNLLDHPFE